LDANERRVPPRTIYLVGVLALVLVLCLALVICLAAAPRPPRLSLAPAAVSGIAAQSAEDKLNAVVDAPLGPVSVDLSDEEATSFLALDVPGSPFLQPQVHFDGGKAYISGVVDMGVPLKVQSVWAFTTEGAEPSVVLERASVGPFALPAILLNSVSSTVNQMIAESGTGILPTAVRSEGGHIVVDLTKSTPTVP
jgi:hypothetical protein